MSPYSDSAASNGPLAAEPARFSAAQNWHTHRNNAAGMPMLNSQIFDLRCQSRYSVSIEGGVRARILIVDAAAV